MGKALDNAILLNSLAVETVDLFRILPGSVRSAVRNSTLAPSADVTNALLDCINDNPGKTIMLPPGGYRVSGTFDLTANNTLLEGSGQSTRIFQYTPDIDTFRLRPSTAGVTSAFLNSVGLRNMFVSHSNVAAGSTHGAAARLTQCAAWRVTGVYTADADIFVEGGQAGFIDDIWGYAVNGSYRGTDSAMLHFVQAAYGASSYQPMFTTQVGRINLSGGGKRDTVIRVANCDGLSFGKGYANNSGGNSIFKIKAERDNSYVSDLDLGQLYLDAGPGPCALGIDIPADGFANSFIYHLILPSTVKINGAGQQGIRVRKDIQNFNNDALIINCTLWGVDYEGDSTNSVLKFSPTTSNNGDAASGDIRIGGSGRSLSLTGWKTKGAETVALLLAAGTWGRGVIANCVNDTNIADISNLATFTGALDFNGNVSAYTGAVGSSWRGLNQVTAKTTPVDADVLSLWDSAASWFRKSLTIANLKAALFSGWGALINTGTSKATPVDADAMAIMDSAASNATKTLTWANLKATLKTYLDTLYQPLLATLTSWGAVTRASGFDTFAVTPSSANLAALLTDELGSGNVPFTSVAAWTPVLTCATPGDLSVAYSTQSGYRVRIGNCVLVHFNIVTSTFTWTTASGNMRITGFGVTADANQASYFGNFGEFRGITKANYTQFSPVISAGGTIIEMRGSGSGQIPASLAPADFPTGGTVRLLGFVIFNV